MKNYPRIQLYYPLMDGKGGAVTWVGEELEI